MFSIKYRLIYSMGECVIYPCERFGVKFWKGGNGTRSTFCVLLLSSTKFPHFLERVEDIVPKPHWIPIGRISKIAYPCAKGVFLYFGFFSYGFTILLYYLRSRELAYVCTMSSIYGDIFFMSIQGLCEGFDLFLIFWIDRCFVYIGLQPPFDLFFGMSWCYAWMTEYRLYLYNGLKSRTKFQGRLRQYECWG